MVLVVGQVMAVKVLVLMVGCRMILFMHPMFLVVVVVEVKVWVVLEGGACYGRLENSYR